MTREATKRLAIAVLCTSVLCMSARACHAEQIVLHDGTVVKGELVDFSNGQYTVKVGKFLKTIPESRIADVRPDGGAAAPAAPLATPLAPPVARPAAPIAPGARPPMAQPLYGSGAGLPSMDAALQMLKGASGGQPPAAGAVNDTLKKLGANDPGIASAVQQMMGGGGIDMGSIQQLENNPAMQKMIERFRDPAYQHQLIEGLREMQGPEQGGRANPMVDQLQGLFQQLNTLQGQPQR